MDALLDLKLMKDALLLDLIITDTKITPMDEEIVHVRMHSKKNPTSCRRALGD